MKLIGTLTVVAVLLVLAPATQAAEGPTTILPDGTHRITYSIGPIEVTSGQNRIVLERLTGSEKPSVDGWVTRIKPDLVNEDGSIPSSSKVMLHHAVLANPDDGVQGFYATGEEKTITDFPDGYGYRYEKNDSWYLNHMIHNLVPEPMSLYVTYTIDFIPDSDPRASSIKPVSPIWMDVESFNLYPVFDIHRDSGGPDGELTYPQEADDPYHGGPPENERILEKGGVLLNTTGHVHTGGLDTELFLKREGASYAGPTCKAPPNRRKRMKSLVRTIKRLSKRQKRINRTPNRKAKRSIARTKRAKIRARKVLARKIKAEQRAYRSCLDSRPNVEANRVRLFQSKAKYFGKTGPVSWDMAMYSTDDEWRVQVERGDVLEIQTTYETRIGSWNESMGLNIVYMSESETDGDDPYVTKVDDGGVLNHGHYEENNDHGGEETSLPDPTELPDGLFSGGPFSIGSYAYGAGDFRLPGAVGRPPVIKQGESFTFEMTEGDMDQEIWHSLTSCKAPCNKSTGISYPLPDGDFQFDSGQLGNIGAPTVGRTSWSTPPDLPVGTHTFFCRIHPLMRGAFRVKPN
jgi:hypothetical protein